MCPRVKAAVRPDERARVDGDKTSVDEDGVAVYIDLGAKSKVGLDEM